MNVSLRQLRVFRAIADGRNFSRAGDQVGLSQPAVSRSIHELESQLGLKLLDRTTREVVLTEAGQSLALRLARVLDELDQALAEVHGMAGARRGKVRVASSPTLSANLMPACIAECARREPEIEFVLLDRIQQDVLDSVRAGEVDFGVVVEPPDTDDLHGEPILDDPFCLVLPPGHRLAAPPTGLAVLVMRPLLPRVQRSIMLVHRRNRAPSPLAQRVWGLIRDVAGAMRSRAA